MTDDRGSLATRAAPLAVGAVAVALVMVVAAGALPTGDATPDGEEVLDRVEQRYDSAETLAGDATVTVENDTDERSVNVSFVVERPNSTRLSVTHNGSEYVFGTNGSVAWVYDEAEDTVRVQELPENASAWNASDYGNATDAAWNGSEHWNGSWDGNHSKDWNGSWDGNYSEHWNHSTDWNDSEHWNGSEDWNGSWADANVTAEVLRTTTFEGSETYVVGIEPENESDRGNATLWVDTGDYRVHQFRAAYGENVTTIDFEGVQFNASVHESTFQPPDAASVNTVSQERYDSFDDAQENTDISLQRLDAEGYDFEEAVVLTRGGGTVATQQYTGDANVTIVATGDDLPYGLNATDGETVTVNGENATYVERDEGSAVVWETDGVTRAVVADLPRDDLVELAEAVRS